MFGPNKGRGGNTATFGKQALNQFFQNTNLTIILRAHQPASEGASIQKNAQVLTVFSSVSFFFFFSIHFNFFQKLKVSLLWRVKRIQKKIFKTL